MKSASSVVGGRMVERSPHSSSGIVAQTVKGSHVLRIHGYSQTKGLGNCELIKSDTFEIGGHLWYIRYYPDGADTDDAGWIEFTLHLSHNSGTGANASYMFSLLDDIGEPVPSYSLRCDEIRTFHSADMGWGFSQFIEQKALEQSAYLKFDVSFHS